MIRLARLRTLHHCAFGLRAFSSELQKPDPKFIQPTQAQSYSAYVNKMIENPSWEPYWLIRLKKKLGMKTDLEKNLDSELKALLDKAATLLYYDCADNFPYLRLIHEFNLPDYMSSWYKLTLLHVCMCLFKMQSSLDAAAYHQLRDSMLNTLWFDVDKRLELLSEEFEYKLNAKKDMKVLHAVYIQALFEYDEGFLSNDCILAGALWRNLFMSKPVEPIYLNNAVRYTRATIAFLDSLEINEIIVGGVKRWEPAEQLRLE
ncbi:unnamed protein product [Bursaphelenchus xylophilus]|uniref:(pine wood nematode) hypothetical protein n=1 Tax=Bursaphelenchus xylophilus TaxID=6326 RepID=A0A1I7SLT3_BURXY|nr:unnamed protein product [Bursaphelenchus xylophilus]CAG9129820.1 unnamed protein product [Bursaphelenchus xylophilus]